MRPSSGHQTWRTSLARIFYVFLMAILHSLFRRWLARHHSKMLSSLKTSGSTQVQSRIISCVAVSSRIYVHLMICSLKIAAYPVLIPVYLLQYSIEFGDITENLTIVMEAYQEGVSLFYLLCFSSFALFTHYVRGTTPSRISYATCTRKFPL